MGNRKPWSGRSMYRDGFAGVFTIFGVRAVSDHRFMVVPSHLLALAMTLRRRVIAFGGPVPGVSVLLTALVSGTGAYFQKRTL